VAQGNLAGNVCCNQVLTEAVIYADFKRTCNDRVINLSTSESYTLQLARRANIAFSGQQQKNLLC